MIVTLDAVLLACFQDGSLLSAKLHQVVKHHETALTKVEVRPVVVRGKRMFQFAYHERSRVTHKNLSALEAISEMTGLLDTTFRQAQLSSKEALYSVASSSGGTYRIKQRLVAEALATEVQPSHDRVVQYILPEGRPCAFLHQLGVMTESGQVIASRRAKFRQINRFLEMASDVASELPETGTISVIDYGSGKSYLTFALHHYLTLVLGRNVITTGIDRRQDVTSWSQETATKLGMDGLQFICGPISAVHVPHPVHLAVSLHACDTATDEALASAVAVGATVILAAPCCQHELRRQLRSSPLDSMLEYGIMRERLTELVTDTLRARLLAACGYRVQMLEFIESEHTPRNILIRAVKRSGIDCAAELVRYRELADFWHASIAMEQLLADLGTTPGAH